MRRHLLWWLVGIDIALAGALAWLWVTPQGELRNVRWQLPAPIKPELAAGPAWPAWESNLGRFMATLERPLFSLNRRPSPKPDAPGGGDVLGDVRLLGLYTSEGAGGAIARVDGKVRRMRLGDSIGGWTVKEIRQRELVLSQGDDTRTLELRRVADDGAAEAASAGGAAPAAGGPAGVPASRAQQLEKENREARERLARVNALRARIGMPPLPE